MKSSRYVVVVLTILIAAITTLGQAKKPISKSGLVNAVRVNGISYYDLGNKKAKNALVFIHGWTCNSDFWKDSLNEFPEYRVIALDLPGHGKSDKPRATYSMEYFAKAVETVMNDAHVKKAVLVGHSMGTPIAREFYRMHPDRTLGIVIVDGALKTFFPKAVADRMISQMRANYAESSLRSIDGMLSPVKDDSLKKFIRENMLATPDYVAISAMEGMADEKIWKDDKINVPVLAVMAQSPFWPPDVKQIYSGIAPNLDFQMWTGVSHFLFMERPKEFNDQVRLFVERNHLL